MSKQNILRVRMKASQTNHTPLPLPPAPKPVYRAGSWDFMKHPSLFAGTRKDIK